MKIYFSLLDLLYQGPRSKFLSGGGGGLFLASLFLLNYFLFNFSKKVGGGAKAPSPPQSLSLRGPYVLTITRQIINLFPVAVS